MPNPRTRYYSFVTVDYDGTPAQQTLHTHHLAADVLNFPQHGGGDWQHHGRWMIDRGGGGGGQRATRKGQRIHTSGGHGYFSVGYGVRLLGVLELYPFVGVGGWRLTAVAKDTSADHMLLQTNGPLLLTGFGLTLRLWRARVGVRLGWQWTLSGRPARMPYMRLVLGWRG
jgi:hypothetical protein